MKGYRKRAVVYPVLAKRQSRSGLTEQTLRYAQDNVFEIARRSATKRYTMGRNTMDQGIAVRQRLTTMLMALLVIGVVASTASAAGEHGEGDEGAATFFHDYISGPIVQTKCINCHVEGGRSAHTRLVFKRSSDEPDHVALNLQTFVDFLGEPEEDHDHGNDHEDGLEHGPERILTKIKGCRTGAGCRCRRLSKVCPTKISTTWTAS